MNFVDSIKRSIIKFNLNINNRIVLTEGATGNYVVTPIIAALGGAKKVYAYTKDSKFGTIEDVIQQTGELAKLCNVSNFIEIITDLNDINLGEVDILTNTGFLRPINRKIIDKLKATCVIPLMWETWEFRENDIDLKACFHKGIKVYGTNEDDKRLNTKEYIGYMVLSLLLELKHTPISSNILILGCDYFNPYVEKVLKQNNYNFDTINNYDTNIDASSYDAIVLLEHHKKDLLIGPNGFLKNKEISTNTNIIHICGNVDFTDVKFRHIPDTPAKFGYMSYTADYMGSKVVIDLHTAGLKVAEGMLRANNMHLKGLEYKKFMESSYPAMSFIDKKYW